MFCVRRPQIGSGLSRSTTEFTTALEPRLTVSRFGKLLLAPSQYVVTLSSLALVSTKLNTCPLAVIGLPTARLVPPPPPPRVTVLLFGDWLPAASLARTK